MEGDANRRVSFGAWRRAARLNRRRRDRRNGPRTTAPSRTPTTTESAPSSTSRSERHRAQRNSETVRQSAGSAPRPTETNTSTSPPSVPAPESSRPTRWRVLAHHHAPSVPRTDPAPSAAHAEIHWSRSRAQPSRSHQQRDQTRSFTHADPVNAPSGRCHVRAAAACRQGRLRTQPADHRAEQERRLPPSPGRAVHRNLIAPQAESRSTVSSPIFACRSRIVASCSESRDAVPPAKTSSNPSITWRFQAPTWFGWNFVLGGDRLHGEVPA